MNINLIIIVKVMASINQLVSEIAHSVKQQDSVPVRRAIILGIIHARNELIRKTYSNHNYTDKVLQQRVRLSLIDVPDGDLYDSQNLGIKEIKRTQQKVPKPVRLTNNLPFHSVRTSGVSSPVEVIYAKEASASFYDYLPGICSPMTYDYINGYIYIKPAANEDLSSLKNIIVESVFEYPHLIEIETMDEKADITNINYDDEFLLPEDMIGDIKKLIFETWNPNVIRDTNEVPSMAIVR